MQVLSSKSAVSAAILAIIFLGFGLIHGTGHAHGLWAHRAYPMPSYREALGTLQAKIQYCSDCHGPSGQGYRGYYPMPRLAGQSPEYFENQLRAFIERRREPHMAMVMSKVHGVSPARQTALAAHRNAPNPPPLEEQQSSSRAKETIRPAGSPDDNVPAC